MTWDANGSPVDCTACGLHPCECSASVGTDGVTAIDRSKVPWRVWRDVPPNATFTANLITWPSPVNVLL